MLKKWDGHLKLTESKNKSNDSNLLNEEFHIGLTPNAFGNVPSQFTAGFYDSAIGFFNNVPDSFSEFDSAKRQFLNPQSKTYITIQRMTALLPHVRIAIDEIMSDLFEQSKPLTINDHDNETILAFQAFSQSPIFFLNSRNITNNYFAITNFFRQVYIDGTCCIAKVKTAELKNIITSQTVSVDTHRFNFPDREYVFIYIDPLKITYNDQSIIVSVCNAQLEVNINDFFTFDFGLYDSQGIAHGYLLYAYKTANQITCLENMLIPLRLRRSLSRRVFNVDIGNLSGPKALEYMRDIQNKFKYKKHYNISQGNIVSDTNEEIGLVEDYWFASRAGSKGTTVENISENTSVNDDLEDLQYFNKKLYHCLNVPTRRVFSEEREYDYTSESLEHEEYRFSIFLKSLRSVYENIFSTLFKIYLNDNFGIDKNVMVSVNYDNFWGVEREKHLLQKNVEIWNDISPIIGPIISKETALQTVFNLSLEQWKLEQLKNQNNDMDVIKVGDSNDF